MSESYEPSKFMIQKTLKRKKINVQLTHALLKPYFNHQEIEYLGSIMKNF